MAIAAGVSQKASVSGSNTATTSAVTSQAAGSTFVIFGVFTDSLTFSSVSDSKSNSYTQIGTEQTIAGLKARLYYCENGTGGASHTASLVTTGSAQTQTIYFLEITGGKTAGIIEASNAGTDASSPFEATGVANTTPAALILACICDDSGSNPATHAVTNWTIQQTETNGSIYWTGAIATRVVASAATYTPSWTASGATSGALFNAVFAEAPAGGGGGQATRSMHQYRMRAH